jgi:hypothetical protein
MALIKKKNLYLDNLFFECHHSNESFLDQMHKYRSLFLRSRLLAEDEEKWQEKILKLAEQEPKALKPFERELVTYLISSVSGAKVFKNHNPCVNNFILIG